MSDFIQAYSGATIRLPDYRGNSIVQLPAFFHNVLLQNHDDTLVRQLAGKVPLTGVKNVVFFLVDGFGSKQWETYKPDYDALQRFARDGYVGTLDSTFPSSTPVALNALHTNGLMPAQHGLIDWWLYVEEIDQIIATLPFTAMGNSQMDSLLKVGASPAILVRDPTTYEQFEKLGIKSRTFILEDYVHSVYTKTAYQGSELLPHKDVAALFASLQRELEKPQAKPTYNFVYWGGIDAAGHTYGPDSPEHKQAIKDYFMALENFLAQAKALKDTIFAISADHGQVSVDSKHTIYLDEIAGLPELLRDSGQGKPILPWGGQREVFLAIKAGRVYEALALLHAAIGEHAELIESEQALRAGLFGPAATLHPHLKSRIGDIIVLPKDAQTVWYHHPGEEPFRLKGHHGGLSDAELNVSFGLLRLN